MNLVIESNYLPSQINILNSLKTLWILEVQLNCYYLDRGILETVMTQ